MTIQEALFCERSYIGETNCTKCKYYGTDTCLSRESHKMSIEALKQQLSSVSRTNGQVFQRTFPDVKVKKVYDHSDPDKLLGYRMWLGGRSQDFLAEWWDAPYDQVQ